MKHQRIETLDQDSDQLRNRLAILRADRRQALGEIVQEALPRRTINPHALIEGHWECPDPEGDQNTPLSPTGKCIYIVGDDDHCLFCGQPTERK